MARCLLLVFDSHQLRKIGKTRLSEMIQIELHDVLRRDAYSGRKIAPIVNTTFHQLDIATIAQHLTAGKDEANRATRGSLNLLDKCADATIGRGRQRAHDDNDSRRYCRLCELIQCAAPIVAVINESQVIPGNAVDLRRPGRLWCVDLQAEDRWWTDIACRVCCCSGYGCCGVRLILCAIGIHNTQRRCLRHQLRLQAQVARPGRI